MADWKTRTAMEDHFRRHGKEFGARSVDDYARLADLTVREGTRFAYRMTGKLRIGYYHERSKRFVVLDDEGKILSLSRRSVNYVRTQPGSTYGR